MYVRIAAGSSPEALTVSPVEISPLSPARARALILVHSTTTDVGELAQVVEPGPALTMSVLRYVNSVVLGAITRITSCREAIVRIGFEATPQIVSGTVISGAFFDGLAYAGVDTNELWRHVLAVALLAEVAAPLDHAGDAFTAGLRHDVGRLAMSAFDPDRYARVIDVTRHGVDAHQSETLLFGSDHCDWDVRVGWEWQLSAGIVTAAGVHHDPAPGDVAAHAVFTGHRIADAGGDGITLTPAPAVDTLRESDLRILFALGGPGGLINRIAVFDSAMGVLAAA